MADGYDRGRTFNLALLATIHGKRGDVEHACAAGMRAVQLAVGLQSARSRRYIADVHQVLRPHRTAQAARAFTERARQLFPARQDM